MATKPHLVTTDNPVPTELASPHISHADVYKSEGHNRMHAFETGIAALNGELEGQETAYQIARDKRQKEFDAANNVAETEHIQSKTDLLRRIDDMTLGKRMAAAALDVYEEEERKRKAR